MKFAEPDSSIATSETSHTSELFAYKVLITRFYTPNTPSLKPIEIINTFSTFLWYTLI